MRVMGRNYCDLCQKEIGGFEKHCHDCKRALKICDSEKKEAELTALRADNKRLRERLDAVEDLAACYRLQRSPTEKLFKRLEKTKLALKASE